MWGYEKKKSLIPLLYKTKVTLRTCLIKHYALLAMGGGGGGEFPASRSTPEGAQDTAQKSNLQRRGSKPAQFFAYRSIRVCLPEETSLVRESGFGKRLQHSVPSLGLR
jgi:hypothetical protein